MTLRVKNWERFQQYKDRAPHWIKLYRSILNDRVFMTLPDPLQSTLILLWVLAAESVEAGTLSEDLTDLSFRLHKTITKSDIGTLIESGFLVCDSDTFRTEAYGSVRNRIPEKEKEKEKETEKALVTVPVTGARFEELFEDVWGTVPRKQGKPDSLAAFIRWGKGHKRSPEETATYFRDGIRRYLAAPRFENQEWKHGDTLFREIARGSWDEPVIERPKQEFSEREIAEWQRDPLSGAEVRSRAEAISMLKQDRARAN